MLKLKKERSEEQHITDFSGEMAAIDGVIDLIADILKDVSGETNPKTIARKAFSHLDKVNQQRFVLENMLEGLKRGESMNNLAVNYQHLGLMTVPHSGATIILGEVTKEKLEASMIPPRPAGNPNNIPAPEPGMGKWLWGLITGALKKVAVRLMSMLSNALGAIPHFINIKPIVGMAGIFPTLSFQLEAGDMSLHEFWELLMGEGE